MLSIPITKKEKKLIILTAIILIIITSVPYAYLYLQTPPGKAYTGMHFLSPVDLHLYLSYFEQARQGRWIFKDLYTSEKQTASLFEPFFLIFGKLGGALGIKGYFLFQLARILLIPLLLWSLYLFIAYFFKDIKKRRFAFLIGAGGSGLGAVLSGILEPLKYSTPGYYHWPMDLWVPESNIFLTLYHNPLYILSFSLIILSMLFYLVAWRRGSIKIAFWGGVLALTLFLVHPYHVPTIYGALGVFSLFDIIRRKKIIWPRIKAGLVFLAVSFIPIPYIVWLATSDWVTQQRIINQGGYTPVWWLAIIGFGLLIIFSLIEIIIIISKKKITARNIFLISWLLVSSILIYLSFLKQPRRLTEGMEIPMIIFFTYFCYRIKNNFSKGGLYRQEFIKNYYLTGVLLIFFVFFSNIFNLASDFIINQQQYSIFYVDNSEKTAIEYLAGLSPDSAVLSGTYDGNLIPGLTGRTVFIGHSSETAFFSKKLLELGGFFFGSWGDQREIKFLKDNNITHIFYGPEEKKLGSFRPDNKYYLKKIFENDSVRIYEVIYN